MKKIILTCVVLLNSIVFYAQDDTQAKPKYEVKGNAFNLIVFKSPEVAFEYLLNQDSSIGASVMVNLEDIDDFNNSGPYYNEKFAFTPYYRRYISGKYAERFFLETFAMFNRQEDIIYDYSYDYNTDTDTNTSSKEKSTNLAFGLAVGSKFTSPGGFMFEFYGGVGRNIFSSNEIEYLEFVPRLGVSIGYRY
jgi:hypothetical protein